MKFKGLTKLALSGVALAAVAATLGTSTYAWYISNTTATVSGVSGTTAGADTSGSLYAASPSMYTKGKWSNTVTLTPGSAAEIASADADFVTPTALNPVTIANATKTSAFNSATGKSIAPEVGSFVDKTGAVQSTGAVIEFDFYLIQRGDLPRKVNPKLTITNKTAAGDIKKQTVYAAEGNLPGSGLALKQQFAVDAVHALRVEIDNSAAYTGTTGSGTSLAVDTTKAVAKTVYDADRDFESYTQLANTVTGGDANLYYNDVVNGVNLYGCDPVSATVTNLAKSVANGSSANKWASFWLAPDTETHLTFRVWLEGTDAQCFDSCVNQAFDFQFDFELAAN